MNESGLAMKTVLIYATRPVKTTPTVTVTQTIDPIKERSNT